MKTVGVDKLREEKKEASDWDLNPLKKTILELFGDKLSDENYRKITLERMITETEFGFRSIMEKDSTQSKIAKRLISKMKRSKTKEDALMALGEYLLL